MAALSLALLLSLAVPPMHAQSLGWEGPTGVFVTPLAYTAPSPRLGVGRPVFGYHLVDGGDVLGQFSMISSTVGFAQRFEIGYTRDIHSFENSTLSPLWKDGFNIIHGKVEVIPENYRKHAWVPAVSVGGIARLNVRNVGGALEEKDTNNGDAYIVLTKIVTQVPALPGIGKVPVLLSGGVRGTNASLWGLGGNAPGFYGRAFGAAGFVFTGPARSTVILATEAAQQPRRLDGIPALDIPTSLVYAARIVPLHERKLNLDFGCLQAAGKVAPGVDLRARARFAFGISYGF